MHCHETRGTSSIVADIWPLPFEEMAWATADEAAGKTWDIECVDVRRHVNVLPSSDQEEKAENKERTVHRK
jgi:hypothetical protein